VKTDGETDAFPYAPVSQRIAYPCNWTVTVLCGHGMGGLVWIFEQFRHDSAFPFSSSPLVPVTPACPVLNRLFLLPPSNTTLPPFSPVGTIDRDTGSSGICAELRKGGKCGLGGTALSVLEARSEGR
jgi:hypothetical protein